MEIRAFVYEFLCCASPPAAAGCDVGSWQDTVTGRAPAPQACKRARHTLSASAPADWEQRLMQWRNIHPITCRNIFIYIHHKAEVEFLLVSFLVTANAVYHPCATHALKVL